MTKRSMVIGLIILAAAAFIFWRWIGVKPTAMSDLEFIQSSLQQLAPDYNIAEIQDIVEVDSRHLFVPFVSKDGEYGMSFWVWDRFKWELRRVQSDGDPHLWSLRGDDPAGQYLVWNVNPDYMVGEYALYWMRDRNGGQFYGNDFYIPRVQLEHRISLGERTYGTLLLPEQWAELRRMEQAAVNGAANAGVWGGSVQMPSSYRIGYLPILIGEPKDRSFYSTGATIFGDVDVTFLYHLNQTELEGLASSAEAAP
ncbi:hypothetical protein ACX1C1_02690 [Paenibacillus sp. strain BS8-2]